MIWLMKESMKNVHPAEDIGQRIFHRLETTGQSAASLARWLHISDAAVSQWKTGAVVNLRPRNLVRASDFLRCRIRWLAIGEGDEEIPAPLTLAQRTVLNNMRAVPEQDQQTLVRLSETMRREAELGGAVLLKAN